MGGNVTSICLSFFVKYFRINHIQITGETDGGKENFNKDI